MDTQKGDEAWVLAGSEAPPVLRQTKLEHCSLLGEAYAYEMMHGQAVENFPKTEEAVLE
jgi:hypothetical protein